MILDENGFDFIAGVHFVYYYIWSLV